MKPFVVTYLGHQGCSGYENIYPAIHLMYATSLEAAHSELSAARGFLITSENRRSHAGPPVFVPYHAVIAITERVE